MIKKLFTSIMGLFILISMVGCTSKEAPNDSVENREEDEKMAVVGEKTLIVYYSLPGDETIQDVDAMSSASVVRDENGVIGNTQFIAQQIQEYTSGKLFAIETIQEYPKDYDALIDFAADEQDANARPELSSTLENLDTYDTVFVGYPNWWADLPMPVYTFFDTYDMSGKTIIPFVTHGGSGLSNTVEQIKELEPNATVLENALNIARGDVLTASEDVKAWVETIGY